MAQLSAQQVRVGAITNHNQFAASEYKALAKAARRAGIFLLPGVELSINDGNNGVHALLLFDPKQWLTPEVNYIESFLNVVFENVPNRHLEETRLARLLNTLLRWMEIRQQI